jgi:hypothetical protein
LPDLISVASEEFSSSPSKLPSGGWKVTAQGGSATVQ